MSERSERPERRFDHDSTLSGPVSRLEVQMLRDAVADMMQNQMTVARFVEHERLDNDRHQSNTIRLTAIEIGFADFKGYIRGKSVAMAATLTVAIPLLTWCVNALLGPHSPLGK